MQEEKKLEAQKRIEEERSRKFQEGLKKKVSLSRQGSNFSGHSSRGTRMRESNPTPLNAMINYAKKENISQQYQHKKV